MRKRFEHRDKWFVAIPSVIKRFPGWEPGEKMLHVHDDLVNWDMFYYYVATDDKMYAITREDTLNYRRMYLNRWHISKEYLTEVPEITAEMRKQIDNWEEVRCGRVSTKDV